MGFQEEFAFPVDIRGLCEGKKYSLKTMQGKKQFLYGETEPRRS